MYTKYEVRNIFQINYIIMSGLFQYNDIFSYRYTKAIKLVCTVRRKQKIKATLPENPDCRQIFEMCRFLANTIFVIQPQPLAELSSTKWAIEGMVAPWVPEVALINAPVAI